MKSSPKQLATIFIDACEGHTEKKIEEIAKAYVQLLSEYKLLSEWPKIESSIHEIWKERYGASRISIVSAHPLSKIARKAIEEKANGAQIMERVDERLLGGAVVRIDDVRIDGTIAGKLRRMKLSLMQSI